MTRIPIIFASDCPECECCGEPFCSRHNCHYADCECMGPSEATNLGYLPVEINGRNIGLKCLCHDFPDMPALEHDFRCPVRLGFFGADPEWGPGKPGEVKTNEDGQDFLWADTWRPVYEA